MSLDFALIGEVGEENCICQCGNTHRRSSVQVLFEANITHNLNRMFADAGLYDILWHGDGLIARDVLPTLRDGLATMLANPARFKPFSAHNGWGTYEQALPWLKRVIAACEEFPHGVLRCSR